MSVDAATVLRRLARDAVAAQRTLDELAERSVAGWHENGLPASGTRYRRVAATIAARITAVPRNGAGTPSRLELDIDRRAAGRLHVAFRRVEP